MADTRVTPLEITRKFLAVFHSNCQIAKNLNHDYEKNFGSQMGFDGQKIGPTLNIRDPIQANIRSTWAMTQQDITETYHTLTIDTVRGVDLKFSDADLALSIDDFVPRYIESPAKKLAAVIDQLCASYMMKQTPNAIAVTSLAVPTTIDAWMDAKATLNAQLVPQGDRINAAISPQMERKMVSGLTPLQFNPQSTISDMFTKGAFSNAIGVDWFMSQVLPVLATGSETNTSPVVGTFVAASPTALPYTAASGASATWTAGQTFTIAGLYDINFETKEAYPWLKQFVITTNNTASGSAGTLVVSPGIVFDTTSPVQNCYIAAGSINGLAIVLGAMTTPTSVPTTASTNYQTALMWHPDSFAFASVPLMKPRGMDMAETVTVDNLSFRFVRGFDIANARMLSRMDIFFGLAAIRPQWAVKIHTI
jgi:hypothetical protein